MTTCSRDSPSKTACDEVRRLLAGGAHLDPAVLGDARLEARLTEGRGPALRVAVLHAEARAVPGALDLAAVASDELPFIQRTASMRAGVAHRVQLLVELHEEHAEALLRPRDDRLAIVEAAHGHVEALPLRRRLGKCLPVHLGPVPEDHLAAEVRGHGHDQP